MPMTLMEQVGPGCCRPHPLANAVSDALDELHGVISSLTPEQYVRKPVGPVASSIGGHVRHCLDHITALVRSAESGDSTIDYDRRQRGTSIETDRRSALDAIRNLQARLIASQVVENAGLVVWTLASPDRSSTSTISTWGREVAFVLNHTIHHNAMIAVMIKLMGNAAPSAFGFAASTIAHQNEQPCAQ